MRSDPMLDYMHNIGRRKLGKTLIELLVCLLIISIIAAMYLGAIAKAYVAIKKFAEGLR
jgi:prepilin-type N-terminal cleavage/methylation domain-containing protein